MNITDLLVLMQRIGKMHEQMLKELCRQYDLSLIEAKIIAFLHNNPTKDTAGDIVELRMLSKGNVSQAVDLLEEFQMFASLNERLASNVATIYHKGDY